MLKVTPLPGTERAQAWRKRRWPRACSAPPASSPPSCSAHAGKCDVAVLKPLGTCSALFSVPVAWKTRRDGDGRCRRSPCFTLTPRGATC